MKHVFTATLAAWLGFGLLVPIASYPAEAKKRSEMTAAEKKALRKYAKEQCLKKYINQTRQFDRVEILSDGSLRCWWRQ